MLTNWCVSLSPWTSFIVQCDKLTVDIPLHKYAHRKKTRPPFKRASLDDIMSQSELTIQYLNRYFTWIMAGVHKGHLFSHLPVLLDRGNATGSIR